MTTTASLAQTNLTTIVSFNQTNGASPSMVLTQGADGNFYGTTTEGGVAFSGTFFKMSPTGMLTSLYSFCNPDCRGGGLPVGSLLQTPSGNFYGATAAGGTNGPFHNCCGTVFKVTASGTLTTLYSFCALANCADGDEPSGGLVQARNGNFYGATTSGGICENCTIGGTLFEITPTGKMTAFHGFDGTDGSYPLGGLIQGSNGSLYGETDGGETPSGTLFEITLGGKLNSYIFNYQNGIGYHPVGGLIQATDGDFYGVTEFGGSNYGCNAEGCGTVFKITPGGKLTTLYNFCGLPNCADGAFPNGPLVQATDGNFYGTTSGEAGDLVASAGTVFQITPEGRFTTLYTFCALANCADGEFPTAGLLQATNGTFYGTTSQGGAYYGSIFSLSVGLGPFVSFMRNSAKVGQQFGILGYGLTGTSSVSLNGISTEFTIVSNTFITTTVPAGATTGYVTVTTPSGTLTSNVPFHVLP
jgi:uncharacterized repeat protein (TIGR03803 family)